MTAVREFPAGSGIEGRPILHDIEPGVRHLAFHVRGTWYTMCGETVPEDHQCPDDAEVATAPPWVMQNCRACHRLYAANEVDDRVLAARMRWSGDREQ